MRNFSNQQGGRPGGNRGANNRGGAPHREQRDNRESRGNRDSRGEQNQRGGGYRPGGNRPDRGEHRQGAGRFNSHRDSGFQRGPRMERRDRPEPSDRPRFEGSSGPRSSWVEVSGRSVEEAMEEASRRFNVGKNDLKSEVLEEGSKGFLGIGSKPARVKISLKGPSVGPFAEGVLSRLLRGMGLPDKVKVQKDEDGNTVLNIQGPSSGTLIGRHGHTLEALQYLVSKTVQRVTGEEKSIIIVDVESYLERQKDKLRDLAQKLAQKAKETGVEIPMRPMSSKDRRIVHLTLKDHEHVTTESRGEGLRRKVVIVPKVKAENVTPEAAAEAQAAGNVEISQEEPRVEDAPVESAPPAEAKAPETETPEVEPGNAVPKEREIDDNIGNRV
jgi:spoIIIJ-associated protein